MLKVSSVSRPKKLERSGEAVAAKLKKPRVELNLGGRLRLEWAWWGGGSGPENLGKRTILRAAECGKGGWQADCSLGIDQKHRSEEHTSELQSLRHLVC